MDTVKFSDTKTYIADFAKNIQQRLKKLRTIIKKAAPGGTEIIHYNMPAYKRTGVLVWYAGRIKPISAFILPENHSNF